MKNILNFLKTYWWIWLISSVILSLFFVFGGLAIGTFLKNVLAGLCTIGLSIITWWYTFERGQTKSWGIYRILGIIGFLFSLLILYYGSFDGKNNLKEVVESDFFYFSFILLISSLLFFVFGEILLYLDYIQTSINNSQNNALNKNIDSENMTCPRCYGKGFVDLNDIKRLGMENKWGQGFCHYCDGIGEVEKGKTKKINPLNGENGDIV